MIELVSAKSGLSASLLSPKPTTLISLYTAGVLEAEAESVAVHRGGLLQ